MNVYNTNTANEAWIRAAKDFFDQMSESQAESRLGPALEMLHVGFSIENPRERWIYSRFPPLNPAFALAEVVWIINGSKDATFINNWNPALPKYSGNSDEYHGAYGHRLIRHFGFDQLKRAYQVLLNNRNSRQVVLQIWDSKTDFPDQKGAPVSPDIPCNICSLLKVRKERLEWSQIMRSNDFFRGLPYNFVQFTTLQEVLAGWLEVEIGTYNHFSDSLHLYKSDFNNIKIIDEEKIIHNSDILSLPFQASIDSFSLLFEKMLKMTSPSLSSKEFMKISTPAFEYNAMQNILLIVGADIARRKKWQGIAGEVVENCSNLLYKKLWNNWLNSRNV